MNELQVYRYRVQPSSCKGETNVKGVQPGKWKNYSLSLTHLSIQNAQVRSGQVELPGREADQDGKNHVTAQNHNGTDLIWEKSRDRCDIQLECQLFNSYPLKMNVEKINVILQSCQYGISTPIYNYSYVGYRVLQDHLSTLKLLTLDVPVHNNIWQINIPPPEVSIVLWSFSLVELALLRNKQLMFRKLVKTFQYLKRHSGQRCGRYMQLGSTGVLFMKWSQLWLFSSLH